MPKTPPVVLSHWYQLIEGLEASPMEFYASVEQAIERRHLPDTIRSRVDWREGGVLTARREYLRVTRGSHVFDICGAPFGNGFFVSSWLGEFRAGPLVLLGLIVGLFLLLLLAIEVLGFFLGLFLVLLGAPFLFSLMAPTMTAQFPGWDDAIRAIPVIGPLYDRWFQPVTYYRIDTALMFQSAIHSAVLEVVDELTKAKGLRALTADERKPILRDLFQR